MKILKFVDVYERQTKAKELAANEWYYEELDRILDILFEEAVKLGFTKWSDLRDATRTVDGKGLSYRTIVNLGERWTKRPQMRTVLLIAGAVGKRVVLETPKQQSQPVLSVRSA